MDGVSNIQHRDTYVCEQKMFKCVVGKKKRDSKFCVCPSVSDFHVLYLGFGSFSVLYDVDIKAHFLFLILLTFDTIQKFHTSENEGSLRM